MSGTYLNDAYRYDKSNDTWSQLQSIPFSGRGYSYAVSIGDKAYMGFGSTDNGSYPTDWWQYDMNNDSWLQLANFPGNGRNHPAMVVVNNKIYMGCGSNGNGNLGDWWEYDILSDYWSQKSNIIGNNRHHPFYFGIDNYAYVGFGHGSLIGPGSNPSASSYIYNDFYRYNPTNDTWTMLSDFPSEARVAGTQFSYGGKGYILSGDGDDHGPLSEGEFWEYNPQNNSWSQLQSHPGGAIWAPGNFVIGCDVYFLLGQNWNAQQPTDPISVYKYKLSEDCGCTNSLAYNFSSMATFDDGSCCFVAGCTDPLALNYDILSCFDDGSCLAPILGCTNTLAANFDPNANTTIAFGGALDNTFSSGGYFNGNQFQVFNSAKACIIKSALIDSESANTITFELRNSAGTVIDDTTLNVVEGEQQINLNFEVPIGNDMQLGVSNDALQVNGLFRNNSGANYPYNIAEALEITASSANTNPYEYYYFFYNIEVEIACYDISATVDNISPKKTLVKVIDVLGRENESKNSLPKIFIYEDGTIEKKIIVE
jgi:N-acetylneuraminic acid mutarotase